MPNEDCYFFNDTATTDISTLALHDALPILGRGASDTTAVALAAALGAEVCEIYSDVDGVFTADPRIVPAARKLDRVSTERSEEHTSELQSRQYLVCRLLLEIKKISRTFCSA